ncbi:MAG TPA: poly-gamma-glutamate biosynthesis protein PgsC [Firmicutes bacterium]|nr:poly-gamma-glutamate biosynthesis protein PgsC [Bacillota bacterium]
MPVGELTVALVVGITLSIVFSDLAGIVPAGIIVPSFIALIFDQPFLLAEVLLVALLTYYLVNFLGRFIILYGRRKFGAMILGALLIKIILWYVFPVILPEIMPVNGIGLVIPGLIANSIDRQGVVPSIASMFFVGGLTYLALLLYLTFY